MTTSPVDDTTREPRRVPGKVPASTLRDPVQLLALGFGTGLAPVAPGTFGSLVGVLFALAVAPLGFAASCIAALLVVISGIWICDASARRLGVHDHPAIVWDEVAGMMLTMLAAPPTWWGTFVAFGLFRLFDVWKPWPIREVDHGMRGGAGIMLDDVMAAIMAAGVLLLGRSVVT
jgi:phosphatidylglycerophosphatase A